MEVDESLLKLLQQAVSAANPRENVVRSAEEELAVDSDGVEVRVPTGHVRAMGDREVLVAAVDALDVPVLQTGQRQSLEARIADDLAEPVDAAGVVVHPDPAVRRVCCSIPLVAVDGVQDVGFGRLRRRRLTTARRLCRQVDGFDDVGPVDRIGARRQHATDDERDESACFHDM